MQKQSHSNNGIKNMKYLEIYLVKCVSKTYAPKAVNHSYYNLRNI